MIMDKIWLNLENVEFNIFYLCDILVFKFAVD
jgi:hypothetical protein